MMPQARAWSETADLTICQLRSSGTTWAEIGRCLGLSRNTVIERGRRLHAQTPVKPPAQAVRDEALDDPRRGALPAGHRLTWGLLTDEPYPEHEWR